MAWRCFTAIHNSTSVASWNSKVFIRCALQNLCANCLSRYRYFSVLWILHIVTYYYFHLLFFTYYKLVCDFGCSRTVFFVVFFCPYNVVLDSTDFQFMDKKTLKHSSKYLFIFTVKKIKGIMFWNDMRVNYTFIISVVFNMMHTVCTEWTTK